MSDDSIMPEIKAANDGLSKLDKTILKLTESTGKFLGLFRANGGQGFGGSGAGSGQLNLGTSGNSMMGGSLANVGSFLQMNRMANVKYSMGIGAIQAGSGILAGAFQAMPDFGMAMGRASGFYQSALLSGMGANGRGTLARMTLANMNGGVTSAGSDATTAAMLVGMGVNPNSVQFSNLTTSISNAAKYMGMSNEDATRAMGGLTQGGMSSNLMRNFGLYTTNPVTGQRLSPTQIISQLAERMTGGQKLSVADLQTSLQGGALAVNLSQIGDQATAQLVQQYLIDQAQGKNMDLGNSDVMARLAKEAGVNPQQAQMTLNSSNANLQNAATDSFIKGMQDSVSLLTKFNDALRTSPLLGTMGYATGFANTFGSSNAGQGLSAAVGGVATGLGTVGSSVMNAALLSSMMGKGSAAGAAGASAARSMSGVGLVKGLGYAGSAVETVAGVATGNNSLIGGGIGSAIGAWLGGLAGGVLGEGAGAIPGMMIGSGIGQGIGAWIGGMIPSGGDGSTINQGEVSGQKGTLSLITPVKGRMTCKYGVKDKNHPNGHRGNDYGVGIGTPIKAGAAGTVKRASGSSKNTYGTSDRSFGLSVEIDHGNGFVTIYGHMSSTQVKVGTKVEQGDIIGNSGNSGFSSGPHLHYELRKNGSAVDINKYIKGGSSTGGSATSDGQAGNAAGDQAGAGSSASNSTDSTGSTSGGSASDLGYSVSGTYASPSSISGAGSSGTAGGGQALGVGASSVNTGGAIGNGTGGGPDGGGNNITINVTVAQASESEARRFAKLVKDYLSQDTLMANMGAM